MTYQRAVIVAIGILPIELNRLRAIRDPSVILSLTVARITPPTISQIEIRFPKLDSFRKIGFGLLIVRLAHIRPSALKIGVGPTWIQLERLVEIGQRTVIILLCVANPSPPKIRPRISGIKRHCLCKIAQSKVVFALNTPKVASIIVSPRRMWIKLDS